MSKKMENGLFIFRRDLRIVDNNGLNVLSELCKNIYAIFVFTPEQISNINKYKSNNAIQFMIESLNSLSLEIKKQGGTLYTFYGKNNKVISDCIKAWNIEIVAFNLDITPYSRIRDDDIVKMCEQINVFVTYNHDYYLTEPGTILNNSGQPYVKFTPYYNKAKNKKVEKPFTNKIYFKNSKVNVQNKVTLDFVMKKFVKNNPNILVNGGRINALKQIQIAKKNIKHYEKTRDELFKPTSQLSAYIKFGCVSIREVYHAFKNNDSFIRQLYWRDFYGQVLYHHPDLLKSSLNKKYDKIKWHNNNKLFDAWSKGVTGIPIVDASQRQLLHSGWTHNRGRMISSSILIKILLIDWRAGERFYAQNLIDYDVANNNGGWGWSSGGGSDAQPFFRYFNPYTQSKEHDSNCEYIKKWIPELKNVDVKDIHNWDTAWEKHTNCGYPKPIVNYNEQREKSIKMYKDALD